MPTNFMLHFKSLAWLWRHMLQFGGVIGTVWFLAGSVIEPKAQEVMTEMLLENPAFKELSRESDEQGSNIKKMQEELKVLQGTLDDVSVNSNQTKTDINEIKGDVDRLVQALINRRSSVEDMPPWSETVQP